jgi:cysteine synthase A
MIYEDSCEIVLDDVFLRLPGFLPGVEVLLKIEGLNPAGSIKLKTALSLVQDLEECARLRAGSRLIESSSGNLGRALSVVCAAKGYALTIVTDPNASPASIRMMQALGTDVVVVSKRDANGGFLGTRIAYIQSELAQDSDLVWPNQYANHANAAAHYERTARSIHSEVPQADAIVIGVGTCGTLMGCLSYYLKHSPDTRIIAVDAAGSVLFGGPAGTRHIPGIGASRVPELFADGGEFEKVLVPEAEAVAVCWRLARERGLAVGGSTGSVLAAVQTLASTFAPGDTVVAISPDLGEQYLESVYERSWVGRHFGGRAVNGG